MIQTFLQCGSANLFNRFVPCFVTEKSARPFEYITNKVEQIWQSILSKGNRLVGQKTDIFKKQFSSSENILQGEIVTLFKT